MYCLNEEGTILVNSKLINIEQDTKNNIHSVWRSGKISHSVGFSSVDRTPNPL